MMYNHTNNEILHNVDKSTKALARSGNGGRLKRDLSHEAISLALKGEWERATEVNRAILELFEDDVDAMNRLGKALMELAQYDDAKKILNRVVLVAPYNNIAKKNIARLTHLGETPAVAKQGRPRLVTRLKPSHSRLCPGHAGRYWSPLHAGRPGLATAP